MNIQKISLTLSVLALIIAAALFGTSLSTKSKVIALADEQELLELISKYMWALDSGVEMEQMTSVFTEDAVVKYVSVGKNNLMALNENLVGIKEIHDWLANSLAAKAKDTAKSVKVSEQGNTIIPGHFFSNAIIDVDGDKADVRFIFPGSNFKAAYWGDAVKVNGQWRFKMLLQENRVTNAQPRYRKPGLNTKYSNPEYKEEASDDQ